jgi:hypothetical protein
MPVCYDIEGNSVDCGDYGAIGIAQTTGAGDVNAGLDLTSQPTVAGITDSHNNGGSALSTFFGQIPALITSVGGAIRGTSTSSNLRLQLNPTTGKMQYFNPATGTYVGAPVNQNPSIFTGSSMLLLAFAALVAFLAFGRKRG